MLQHQPGLFSQTMQKCGRRATEEPQEEAISHETAVNTPASVTDSGIPSGEVESGSVEAAEEVKPLGIIKLNQAELNRYPSAEKHELDDSTKSVDIVIRDDMGEHEDSKIIGYYDKEKNEIGISRSLFERPKTDIDAAAKLLCLIPPGISLAWDF